MADADELERALLARWDRDTLVVYADCLQAAGDPRGELIALDLEIAERGITPELATRRRKRLYEWLGGSTILGAPWHERSFRFGFATDFVVTHDRNAGTAEYTRALFASPAGAYVKGVTIYTSSPKEVQEAFAVLASATRPWLERIELRVVAASPLLSERLVRAVIAATPRLRELAAFGVRAVAAFPHPGVRRFACESPSLDLVRDLPAVEHVELALDRDDLPPSDRDIATTLATLANLRVLDLSRNEPHYPPQVPPNVDIYPFATALALPRLATLRMPSLRVLLQVELAQAMLERHPELVIEVARTYEMYGAVHAIATHPRLRVPVPRPWPPRDTLSSREALTIQIPTEEYGDDVSLTRLIDQLEDQFDELPAGARAAWDDFWAFLAELPWEDRVGNQVVRPFPAATLLAALDPLDDVERYSRTAGHWAQLAEKLRAAELPAGAEVQIRRYWGW